MRNLTLAILLVAVALPFTFASETQAAEDGVVAMYFHRTVRCPTCKTIGEYVEEAVKQGFTQQIDNGSVSLHYIDFQNAANANMKNAYKIEGPTFVLAKVRDGRVVLWKTMPGVWQHVRDKTAFLKYVRDGVSGYLAN